ncbi:hypothetical protein [Paraburkholderia graminis]|uniref:Queuine/archaeosine tRNA-ribosyltransferase n=1 Tax=Paraburkholderia graminis TaxID=60548 RepID=A0ABD5CLF2_9BURK|nr:hypothetical protein [Paraburkholderia graminis]MDR6205365.1 queuine/archaeosine tRNA-ribosyltransferase [Paraburkholderia graminis]
MESHTKNSDAARLVGCNDRLRPKIAELLTDLLTDIVIDVEVVARELNLREEMRERLRRALDRMACAQSVLETVCTEALGAKKGGATAELRVREAVGLLAREWPEEYPAGAVEWLLAAPDVRPTPMALDLFGHGK